MDTPLESVLFSREMIAARVRELADEIAAACRKEKIGELTLVAVADGALVFAADLMRELAVPVRFASVRTSCYGAGTTPGSRVEISGPLPEIAGGHVLVVEDILDTGNTIKWLIEYFAGKGAASLSVVTLLDKKVAGRPADLLGDTPFYAGFDIPDDFVIGYGLDYNQLHRNLPSIYKIHKAS